MFLDFNKIDGKFDKHDSKRPANDSQSNGGSIVLRREGRLLLRMTSRWTSGSGGTNVLPTVRSRPGTASRKIAGMLIQTAPAPYLVPFSFERKCTSYFIIKNILFLT